MHIIYNKVQFNYCLILYNINLKYIYKISSN
nr:MAG TPA: hypothetical protein [Caudoviricetes sp.]